MWGCQLFFWFVGCGFFFFVVFVWVVFCRGGVIAVIYIFSVFFAGGLGFFFLALIILLSY